MPSKRRSRNRPSQDRTDTRDTRKTIGPYIYIYIYIYTVYSRDGKEGQKEDETETYITVKVNTQN